MLLLLDPEPSPGETAHSNAIAVHGKNTPNMACSYMHNIHTCIDIKTEVVTGGRALRPNDPFSNVVEVNTMQVCAPPPILITAICSSSTTLQSILRTGAQ